MMPPAWHLVRPDGSRSDAYASRDAAIRAAVAAASDGRAAADDRLTGILWRSLERAGWRVEEGRARAG